MSRKVADARVTYSTPAATLTLCWEKRGGSSSFVPEHEDDGPALLPPFPYPPVLKG
jgi:hypothetical protein